MSIRNVVSVSSIACALALGACSSNKDSTAPASGSGVSTGSQGGSSQGGAGGGGGSGTGAGGAGGSAQVVCLPDSSSSASFKLADTSLCVVAKYTAPFVVGFDTNFNEISPSWGRHQGPLTLKQEGGNVTLTRWKVPAGATGALTAEVIGPIATQVAPAEFINATAVDLPFNNWTAIGWAKFMSPNGELLLLNDKTVAKRFNTEGLFAVAGLHALMKDRILSASFSEVGKPGAKTAGLYYADVCGQDLCASGTGNESASGDAGGPIAVDLDGNVFASFPSIAGDKQSVRGFAAGLIAPGKAPMGGGFPVFSLAGGGQAMAAMPPRNGSDGYILFQPDTKDFVYLDPIVQRYAVPSDVAPKGTPKPALTLAKAGTEIRLMSDDQGRIWVGVVTDAMKGESAFFVLDRAPAK